MSRTAGAKNVRVRVYRTHTDKHIIFVYAYTMKHAVEALREKISENDWNASHVITWSVNEIGSFPVGTLIKENRYV